MDKLSIKIDIEKYLICQKCKLIVENPYEGDCCGILFCYSCIKNSKKLVCLKCNKKSEFRQNSFIKRIINHMNINCAFNCGSKFKSIEIKKHMTHCEYRIYQCNVCDKNIIFTGKKEELLNHMIKEHVREVLDLNDQYEEYQNFKTNQLFEKKSIFNMNAPLIEEIKENPYLIRSPRRPMETGLFSLNRYDISSPRNSRSRSIEDNSIDVARLDNEDLYLNDNSYFR